MLPNNAWDALQHGFDNNWCLFRANTLLYRGTVTPRSLSLSVTTSVTSQASGAHQGPSNPTISFWRFSSLPHTRICRWPSICTRETCQRRWGYQAHHLRRKLAPLLRQPRCQRRLGSYLSYFYIHIRKRFTNCRSPACLFPLRQDSFFLYVVLNSDPSDPDVIIKLDISNAFNVLYHQLILDVLEGKASFDYAAD